MKQCSGCKRLLPLDAFHRCSKSKDGRKNRCRECRHNESMELKQREKIFVEFKKCSSCNLVKHHDEFTKNAAHSDGLDSRCLDCNAKKTRTHNQQFPEEKKARDAEYYLNNKDKIIARQNDRDAQRYQEDIHYRLRRNISRKVCSELKKNGVTKEGKSILKYLAYSIEELRAHLENLFEPWMNWDNHGVYRTKDWYDDDQSTWTWQIDHIIPQSNLPYTSMEDDNFKKCWALENLRPYPAKQNFLDGITRTRHIS